MARATPSRPRREAAVWCVESGWALAVVEDFGVLVDCYAQGVARRPLTSVGQLLSLQRRNEALGERNVGRRSHSTYAAHDA